MSKTLVIMAAGAGSRFGGPKQGESFLVYIQRVTAGDIRKWTESAKEKSQ